MIGWALVILLTIAFAVVMGLIVRTSLGPLTDTDRLCSSVDEALDAEAEMARESAGWRNA